LIQPISTMPRHWHHYKDYSDCDRQEDGRSPLSPCAQCLRD